MVRKKKVKIEADNDHDVTVNHDMDVNRGPQASKVREELLTGTKVTDSSILSSFQNVETSQSVGEKEDRLAKMNQDIRTEDKDSYEIISSISIQENSNMKEEGQGGSSPVIFEVVNDKSMIEDTQKDERGGENEAQVSWFLDKFPEFKLESQTLLGGIEQASDTMFVAVFAKES